MSDDGEVIGGETRTQGRLVFVELDIEAPVKSVLHFPMAARRMSDAPGVRRQGTYVVAPLVTGLINRARK